MKPGSDLSGVDSLVIPTAPVTEGVLRSTLYKPRRGDTLVTIADRFGVTVQQLRRWNNLRGTAIPLGRSLYVSEPARISGLRYGKKRLRSARPTGKAVAKTANGGHAAHATKKNPT